MFLLWRAPVQFYKFDKGTPIIQEGRLGTTRLGCFGLPLITASGQDVAAFNSRALCMGSLQNLRHVILTAWVAILRFFVTQTGSMEVSVPSVAWMRCCLTLPTRGASQVPTVEVKGITCNTIGAGWAPDSFVRSVQLKHPGCAFGGLALLYNCPRSGIPFDTPLPPRDTSACQDCHCQSHSEQRGLGRLLADHDMMHAHGNYVVLL